MLCRVALDCVVVLWSVGLGCVVCLLCCVSKSSIASRLFLFFVVLVCFFFLFALCRVLFGCVVLCCVVLCCGV